MGPFRLPSGDETWADGGGPVAFQISLATFGILALELALIRWASGQIRAFAYFSNLVLIAAFLGMGLGLAAGRRRPGLVHWTLPGLAVLAAVLGLAEPLGIVRLRFPDPSVHMWGAETVAAGALLTVNLLVFLALVTGIVAVFLFAGAAVGFLFPRLAALESYRWDLTGSLLGVVAVTVLTSTGAGPAAWLGLGTLPFAWLSRRPLALASGAVVIALAAYSARGAVFSPYNRIDLQPDAVGVNLEVNRDFHQYMHDLSDRRIEALAPSTDLRPVRRAYDLPFAINDRRGSALAPSSCSRSRSTSAPCSR